MKLSLFNRSSADLIINKATLLAALILSSLLTILVEVPNSAASPTFSNYPISSTFSAKQGMTVAGGDLWYLQTSSGPTTLTLRPKLITGPDGNVWFAANGINQGFYIGRLDISTGTVSFYAGGGAYSGGDIGAGPDGKIYYSYKSAGSGISYLMSLNPATGTTSTWADCWSGRCYMD